MHQAEAPSAAAHRQDAGVRMAAATIPRHTTACATTDAEKRRSDGRQCGNTFQHPRDVPHRLPAGRRVPWRGSSARSTGTRVHQARDRRVPSLEMMAAMSLAWFCSSNGLRLVIISKNITPNAKCQTSGRRDGRRSAQVQSSGACREPLVRRSPQSAAWHRRRRHLRSSPSRGDRRHRNPEVSRRRYE